MADFEQLKASVASIIRTNGAEAITGAVLQDVLLTMINSIADGYMFGGVAQHSGSVGNPDYNVFYLGGSGSYTGYGGSIDVPAGSYCVFAYDGAWHQSVIDLGISLGGTVSEGETQGVTGDAVNTALNTLWENITNILDSIEFSDDTSELYKGDRITQVMRVTAGGVERLLSSFTILAATVQKAGLMSAADKRKLDNFVFTVQDMIETMTVSDVTGDGDTGTRIDESIEWTVDEVTHQIATFTLLAATAVKAGLMSNTDKQAVDALFTIEAEDTTAVDDLGVKLTETLNWTVNNVSQIFAEFTLLAATQSKAGLMSAADKAKLDAYENNIRSMEIVDTTGNADKGDQITETLRWVFGGVSTVITTFTLLAATHTKAGLMSAVDKQLVDALLTIIAQDTTAQADEKTSMTQSLKWTRGGTQQTMASITILAATAEKAGLMSADDKAKIDAMLTGGYMFAGVATTSTNPTTGTEKMFYIAIEAGEYTHFDGLTVDRGINILMYDGSDWNAVTVVGIDERPTKDSSALVVSGSVYPTMVESAQNRADISQLTPIEATYTVSNKVIKNDGTESASASYQYQVFPVIGGKRYTFSCKFSGGGFFIVHWFNGSEYLGHEPYVSIAGTTVEYHDKALIAPDSADTCIINESITLYSQGYYSFKEVSETLKETLSVGIDNHVIANSTNLIRSGAVFDLYENTSKLELLTPDSTIEGKIYSVAEHDYIDLESSSVRKYLVEGGKSYTFRGRRPAQSTYYFVIWFNSDDEEISYEPYHGNMEEAVEYVDQPITAPDNAAYLLFNFRQAYANDNIKAIVPVNSGELDKRSRHNQANISNSIALEIENQVNGILGVNGNFIENTTFAIRYYPVTGGNQYLLTGTLPSANAGVYMLHWLDENDNQIFADYRCDDIDGITLMKEPVIAPAGAVKAAINVRKDRAHLYNFGIVEEYIDVEEIKREINKKADLASISELVPMEPEILANQWYNYKYSGSEAYIESNSYEIWKYSVEEGVEYSFSSSYPIRVTIVCVGWFDENGELIEYAPYKGSMDYPVIFVKEKVVAPTGAAYAYLNVRKSEKSKFGFYRVGNLIDINEIKSTVERVARGNFKIVANADKSFYVRGKFDNLNDCIVEFAYSNLGSNINPKCFYVGLNTYTDNEIFASSIKREFRDEMMPISTNNFGPFGANHGLSTPRITVTDHGLTDADLGTTWIDENDWDYTIVKISGNYIYLMPVIHNKEEQGHEYRGWTDYQDIPKPAQITRNGVTLISESTVRVDYNTSELSNIKLIIDGVEAEEGTYYGNKVELQFHQTVYDPADIDTWVPTPVYGRVMYAFDRYITLIGTDGFIGITYNTKVDAKEFINVNHYNAAGLMMTVGVDDYDSYICIPKLTRSGFTEEFISNTPEGSISYFTRNTSNLVDVDDLPDRIYSYLKKDDDVLFGEAGGVSLVRGGTMPSVRNNNIPANGRTSYWSPSAGNKFYITMLHTSEIFDSSIFFEFEFYTAFYKPENDVQSWFYKSGNEYILYIHTKSTHTKDAVKVPDLLNGLNVKGVVEKTDNISYLNDIISNGKLYINSGSGYEYLVLRIG